MGSLDLDPPTQCRNVRSLLDAWHDFQGTRICICICDDWNRVQTSNLKPSGRERVPRFSSEHRGTYSEFSCSSLQYSTPRQAWNRWEFVRAWARADDLEIITRTACPHTKLSVNDAVQLVDGVFGGWGLALLLGRSKDRFCLCGCICGQAVQAGAVRHHTICILRCGDCHVPACWCGGGN